jgi:hypothetical protein
MIRDGFESAGCRLRLNRDALLDYWHQRIDAADFGERMKPIER